MACNVILTHNRSYYTSLFGIADNNFNDVHYLIIHTRKTIVFMPEYILHIAPISIKCNLSSPRIRFVVKLTFLLNYTDIRSVV